MTDNKMNIRITRFSKSMGSLLYLLSFLCLSQACNRSGSEKKAESAATTDSLGSRLKLQPGFKAEHLYSPSEDSTGSWVSMVFDDKGRMITSDQYGAMYRVEIPPIGTDSVSRKVRVTKLQFDIIKAEGKDALGNKIKMGYAQGLVWAFHSLYVVVNHNADSNFEKTSGLYRLQDTNDDDVFDKISLLTVLIGEEEHGPHSIKVSPDGNSLYITAGNNTKLPENIKNYTMPPVWQRDNILPNSFDLDPRTTRSGGWIAKVDSSGKKWELVAAGLRNTFDIAFNESGDLFTYDSDMEWDIGMPWYRPTRICHITSGGELGWRDANGKWSPEYLDNLPPILNIGQGSPTNVVSAMHARFPGEYRNTILAFDWSFGIIYAIHLKANGSSYEARGEEFVSGAPLPLTDGVIGPDGALYFLTGGRRLESHLYRVYYEDGNNDVVSSKNGLPDLNNENKLRRQLEQFHGQPDSSALAIAWPELKNPDRFIRYAARIAIEHQPVKDWQEKVLKEQETITLINGMVALARHGDKGLKPAMLNALMQVDYNSLEKSVQVDLLRVFELVLARMGKPDAGLSEKMIEYLTPHFPASTNQLNRGLIKVLGYLDDPSLVAKTLSIIDKATDDSTDQATFSSSSDLLMRNPQYGMDIAGALSKTPPAQQIFYAIVLSEIKSGWNPQLREQYFKWFHRAYEFKGGRHYVTYIDRARESALANVPKKMYKHFDTLSTNTASVNEVIDWVRIMSEGGPGRRWAVQEAMDTIGDLSNRDFEQGKLMFRVAACSNCHSVRGEGGAVGPDLTQLGTRFSKRDILESIIDPNKTISDQYAATIFSLKDGSTIIGRLVREENGNYFISQNPFDPNTLRQLEQKNVISKRFADISPMPPLLINQLNSERLRDLLAFLISGGNENHPVFSKRANPENEK